MERGHLHLHEGSGIGPRAGNLSVKTDVEPAWVTRSPPPELLPFVESYHGYRTSGGSGLHRGLPSRHLTFIVSIGTDIDVIAQTDPAQAPGRYRAVLSGLQASSALISNDGPQEGVAIELTPVGVRALLGVPASALWNTTVELADVLGPTGDELWERMQHTRGWAARFAICDELLGRAMGVDTLEPALARAWRLILESGGTGSVSRLAECVGWTRQHLARRFAAEYGLSPKLAARVVRFERACATLREVPFVPSIAQVAAACGYYDQAHLNRDFVALAGCTPSHWLADELPFVQDTAANEPRE